MNSTLLIFSRVVKYMKIGVRIHCFSVEYVDIHRKLVNSTPFSEGNFKYMKIGVGIQFFDVEYTDIRKKLANCSFLFYCMVSWCLYETLFWGHLLRLDYQPLFGKVAHAPSLVLEETTT